MDFKLTQEQSAIKEMVKNFADNEIAPHAKKWDEEYIFPVETLRKAAELGLSAVYVKSDIGGSGLTRLDSTIIFEELAVACPSTAAYLSIHNMVCWLIDTYATNDLRKKYLPKLINMEHMSSYCLTEPSAGSDAASLKTSAVIEGNDYILNGAKSFISGGSVSDIYVCMVRTGEEGPKGISCLLIENGTPGLAFGKKEKKLGWHSQPTTMVFFEDCRVPIANRIGEVNTGFKIALSALNGGRLNIAACSLGGAKACIAHARQYMLERKQFKQKLADFEALQFKFADMLTNLHAARLMVHQAAYALDRNEAQANIQCAMAKRFATDVCFDICNQALQIFGGYGYIQEYPIEKYVRDLRVHQILEGTNEIMRLIIAKHAFQKTFTLY